MNRRSLLKRGLVGGALLAVGGGGFLATRRGTKLSPPPEGLLVLDEHEYAIVTALAQRIIPDRAGFPSAAQIRVAFNADRVLAKTEPSVQKEVKQLVRLFDNALVGFLFSGNVAPFTSLSAPEQDRVLADWRDSRVLLRRTGFQALRQILLASYYGSPKTWGAVGYPGPPAGFHQPDAPEWKGVDEPRPKGNGAATTEVPHE